MILFSQKKSNYLPEAPFGALRALDGPCSVQVQVLLLHALLEFLICISQVRLLLWLQLLQRTFTMASERMKKPTET